MTIPPGGNQNGLNPVAGGNTDNQEPTAAAGGLAPQAARRCAEIEPFRVVQVLERARALGRAGHDVIHLEVGEPDFETPEPIVAAGQAALAAGHTRYTEALGLPQLRQAIAGHYQAMGVALDWERVVVTTGASGALVLAAALLLDPGTELLLPDPGYPCNEVFARLVGARPVPLATAAAGGFAPTPDQVRAAWSPASRALLLASPSNPTGAVLAPEQLRELIATVAQLGGLVLLDEIYQGLVFDAPAPHWSGLSLTDEVLIINSFSKYFGMTGWRLGWMVAPARFIEPLSKLAQNLFISPSAPAQQAALAAFSEPVRRICEDRRSEFAERRAVLLQGLRQLGFGVPVEPAGAFYLYADLRPLQLGVDALTFCNRLLEEEYVAVTPGIDFGNNGTEFSVRFAYTDSVPRIHTALERIERALVRWQANAV